MNKAVFLQRVKARAAELGFKSERALGMTAGIGPDAIRHLRIGRTASLSGRKLSKLAETLQVSIDWLIGKTADNAYRAESRHGDFDYVMVIGEVQAGAWREAVEWPEAERYPVPAPSDNRHPGLKRFALEVAGQSMNEIYPDGAIVFCVRYDDLGRGPKHGEKVIVLRFRRGFVEATCKEFIVKPDGSCWLLPRSTSSAYKPMRLPKTALDRSAPVTTDDGPLPAIVRAGDLGDIPHDTEDLAVVAKVTGCYIQQ